MRILVIGSGSVGKRHLKNLASVDVTQLGACDTRPDRLEDVKKILPHAALFTSLDEALAEKFDGAVIATPPHLHVKIGTLLVQHGVPMLIEKPLANKVDGVEEFLRLADQKQVAVVTGYTYRFWPPLLKFRELIQSGAIGRVYNARIQVSEYLPDWHPWEDYRDFFMAKKEQGGGALLDESHMIDFARWIYGDIEEMYAINDKRSVLEITSDDFVEMIVRFQGGTVGSIHMDIYGQAHRKDMEAIGEKGNLIWDYHANTVRWYKPAEKKWETFSFSCERNDMFVEEVKQFLDVVKNKTAPFLDGWDGLQTLRCVEAARVSAETKKAVSVSCQRETSRR